MLRSLSFVAGLVEAVEAARASCGGKVPALSPETLETVLEALCAHGRAAHPSLALEDGAFVAHLARCGTPLDGDVETIRADDLFLACACLAGTPGAIEHMRAVYSPRIARYVRRFGATGPFLDEVEQRLWDALLLGAEGGPRLARYEGRGALDRWIGVSAQRIALMMMRHEDVEERTREAIAAEAQLIPRDPELDAIKGRYRAHFERAIGAAFSTLDARDKVVYRMHLVDGLTLDRIGKAYGVHHTTVLRWLEAARERVLDEAKRHLRAELALSPDEFESLVRLLVSQLELDVSRLLGSGERPAK
jgi:RNA polymerase sigma-70 factor (ECF subfamily)